MKHLNKQFLYLKLIYTNHNTSLQTTTYQSIITPIFVDIV